MNRALSWMLSVKRNVLTWNRFPHYATLVVIVMGAIVAWLEYRGHIHENQVKRTLDYVDLFYEPELSRAWFAVYKVQLHNTPRILNELKNGVDDADRVFFEQVNALFSEREDLELYAAQITGLLDDMAICIEMNICDREAADKFLREYAENFWSFYFPFILRVRFTSGYHEYGIYLQRYLGVVLEKRMDFSVAE